MVDVDNVHELVVRACGYRGASDVEPVLSGSFAEQGGVYLTRP
jgi:hypothetical protein